MAAKAERSVWNCGGIKEEMWLQYAFKEAVLDKSKSSAAMSLMMILVVCDCLSMNVLCLTASVAIYFCPEAFCAHSSLIRPTNHPCTSRNKFSTKQLSVQHGTPLVRERYR